MDEALSAFDASEPAPGGYGVTPSAAAAAEESPGDTEGWSPEPFEAEPALASWQSLSEEPAPPATTGEGDDPWASFLSSSRQQPDPEMSVTAPEIEAGDSEWGWQPAPAVANESAHEPSVSQPDEEGMSWSTGAREDSGDEDGGWGDIAPPIEAPQPASQGSGGFQFERTKPADEPEETTGAAGTASPIERGDVARWLDSALDSGTALEPDPVDDWKPFTPAQDAAAPAAFAPQPAFTAGDWQVGDEDDVVLKAFEAHASTEIDEDDVFDPFDLPSGRNTTFTDLLGSEGDDLVAEITEPEVEVRPFARLQGWAPQRAIASDNATTWPGATPGGIPDIDPAAADAADAGFTPLPLETPREPVAAGRTGHSRARTVVREAVETLLLAILVFLAVRASFQNFKVDGQSMYPTLDDGQFLIVNKLVYAEVDMEKLGKFIPFIDAGNDPKRNVFHAPERGDIVVLKDPRDPSQDLIKRIIALPGESVEIRDGKVYINDHYLEEPYIKSAWHDNKSKIVIGEDEYFVMGDNRSNSLDSRSTQIGLVHKDLIIGKAMLSYWPTSSFGLAPNEAGKLASDVSAANGRPVVTARLIEE